jgi:hypothetical protein
MANNWFCNIGGLVMGPMSLQELRFLATQGKLTQHHEVREGQYGDWVPASAVHGLLKPAQPARLAPGPGRESSPTSDSDERADPSFILRTSAGEGAGTAGSPISGTMPQPQKRRVNWLSRHKLPVIATTIAASLIAIAVYFAVWGASAETANEVADESGSLDAAQQPSPAAPKPEASPAAPITAPQEKPGQRDNWINQTYKLTVKRVADKQWQDFDSSGRVTLTYSETFRTKDYVELFCPERNWSIRLYADKQDIQTAKGGEWKRSADGKWEVPSSALEQSSPQTTDSAAAPKSSVDQELRDRWVNVTYSNTLYPIDGGQWEQKDHKTGRIIDTSKETARTDEYVELFCPPRNQTVRLMRNRMEAQNNDKWNWAASGYWEAQGARAEAEARRLAEVDTSKDVGDGLPARWLNESYNSRIYHVKGKEWAEADNKSGEIGSYLIKTARTPEHLELFHIKLKQMYRVSATRLETKEGNEWKWIANGHWQ